MKKRIPFYILLIIIITWIFCIIPKNTGNKYSLEIDNKIIPLIIADTPELLETGLGGRISLGQNSAMLFVFDKPGKYGFWMKDMKFPIDIIWCDEKGQIIYIEKNISPKTFPKNFIPPRESLYVLEVNAGFSDKNHLLVGSILNFIKK